MPKKNETKTVRPVPKKPRASAEPDLELQSESLFTENESLRQELAGAAQKLAERNAELGVAVENYIAAKAEAQRLGDELEAAWKLEKEIGGYWQEAREELRAQKQKTRTLQAMIRGAVAEVIREEGEEV